MDRWNLKWNQCTSNGGDASAINHFLRTFGKGWRQQPQLWTNHLSSKAWNRSRSMSAWASCFNSHATPPSSIVSDTIRLQSTSNFRPLEQDINSCIYECGQLWKGINNLPDLFDALSITSAKQAGNYHNHQSKQKSQKTLPPPNRKTLLQPKASTKTARRRVACTTSSKKKYTNMGFCHSFHL